MISLQFISFLFLSLISLIQSKTVTLSNTNLPLDQNGNPILTGEAAVLKVGSVVYLYFNNWGGCPGVDCCPTGNCASCCFQNPPFVDGCVYTTNHSVVVYSTSDFTSFQYLGEALPLSNRVVGIEFRPHVVYSPSLKLYLMWYEDRYTGQKGYVINSSPNPEGPFVPYSNTVLLGGKGRVGDYDIFVDPETGIAYSIRTGITIVQLNSTYTGQNTSVQPVEINIGTLESPVMFSRVNSSGTRLYYLLAGHDCCACKGGSNVVIYTATSPLGPFDSPYDIGSNTSQVFDPASPYNYITKSQASDILELTDPATNEPFYLFLGNQWVSSTAPGNPRNNDLLYWSVLQFDAAGKIMQIQYQESVSFNI
jgi:hypothetical protein